MNVFRRRGVCLAAGISGRTGGWASARSVAGRKNVKESASGCGTRYGVAKIPIIFKAAMSMSKPGGWLIRAIKNACGAKRPLRYKRRYPS